MRLGQGEIVLINGIADIGIGRCHHRPCRSCALPMLKVDEPTLTMNFVSILRLWPGVRRYVTSRQIWDRLQKSCNRMWPCA